MQLCHNELKSKGRLNRGTYFAVKYNKNRDKNAMIICQAFVRSDLPGGMSCAMRPEMYR